MQEPHVKISYFWPPQTEGIPVVAVLQEKPSFAPTFEAAGCKHVLT